MKAEKSSSLILSNRDVAQLGERLVYTEEAGSSKLSIPTTARLSSKSRTPAFQAGHISSNLVNRF
jgi:hypothetical protein